MSKKKRKKNNKSQELAAEALPESNVSEETVSDDIHAETAQSEEIADNDSAVEESGEVSFDEMIEQLIADDHIGIIEKETDESEATPEDGIPAEQNDDEKPHEEFVEHVITESESKRLRERFRFDWELEDDLKQALDEDASELTGSYDQEPEPLEVKSISLAQAAQTVFGLFLLVFSVIGIVTTCFKISDVIKAQNDNSDQLRYFENFLMPLVASDAPTFDGAASLNEDVIITAACWDIIFNPSVYYEYYGGSYSVSYLDIDRRITKLFGPGLTYNHKTVGDTELTFEYNEESGMYTIPAHPRSPAYYAEVTDIAQTDSGTELTVCYRLPITNWIESLNTVEKTMIYTVVPSETDYNVTAIRIGEIGESEAN